MKRATQRVLMLVPLALAVVSAAPGRPLDDLVRQGNAAFVRADYNGALQLYRQAEEHITDPGLLAFNEAAALYRAGQYRAAELHYRRALEGASRSRRVKALYDLGNCLLQQAGNSDPKGLEEAVSCYEACVDDPEAEAAVKASAAHNLELARLLWQEARKAAGTPPEKNPENGSDGAPRGPNDKPAPHREPGPAGAQPDPRGRTGAQPHSDGSQQPVETTQQTPGKGNLKPLPDRDELVPLPPEDTAAQLEQAAARILRERREYRQGAAPTLPNVKDW